MTVAEQRFYEAVPAFLRDIAAELRRQNDLKQREIELAEAALGEAKRVEGQP